MAKETTTKIKADLSELVKEFQDAQRHIRLVTSEFKASTAGMDKWTENADGLSAKIKQLNGILDAEKTKLKSLESQYALVAKEQGENSKGAQELMIKINNQKAAVDKVESSIVHYSDKLSELTDESKDAESATDKLRNTISEQESDLESLKAKYSDLVLEQGKSSQEAKDTAGEIKKLSSELQQNKAALTDAENAADKFDKSLDDLDGTANTVSDGFTVMKGALADLLADGIEKAIDGLKNLMDFVVESDQAYNKFQAQTGASTEEMKDFKKEMDDLYTNAYGDTLEDIGDKMAYVKQVTGEVDPSKIKELTENAMALEGTFGSDFNETVRGVNNLMTHFGLSSKEAFDLFAKGSQLGLDYTGELGDNIAEYGGNFKQAGYSAEEYFQLLQNGTKNGAYNLDKVNDSINEVKNRLADGTIAETMAKYDEKTGELVEGTGMWSDKTEKAFKAWQDGKGSMKDVINSIVDDINNCEDEQEALNMAATAFGTMGEDANLTVIKALKSTGDEFSNVEGKMNDIKDIRYDDVGTRFTTLGRKLKTELVKPLGEKAIPYFEKLGNWGIKNIDKIIKALEGLAVLIGSVFVINKTAKFVSSIMTMVTAVGKLKTALGAAEAAQKLLNLASAGLPAAIVVAATTAIVAGVIAMQKSYEEAIEQEYGLNEAQKESVQKSQELKAAYDELATTRANSLTSISTEYDYLSSLKDEYNSLVDSNGKVKKGYEDRANFILNQLAEAMGVEVNEIEKLIDKNGQLGDSIDQLILKKQAEASLNAAQEAYAEAIQKSQEALNTYVEAQNTAKEAQEKFNEASKNGKAEYDEMNRLLGEDFPNAAAAYYSANKEVIDGYEKSKEANEEAQKALEDAESAYVGYQSTIQNYEGLSAAIISGDSEKIQDSLQNLQSSFITAETGTKTSLENQVANTQKAYDDMLAAVEAGIIPMESAQVQGAKEMVDKATNELNKYEENARKATENAGQAAADGLNSKIPDVLNSGNLLGMSMSDGLGSVDLSQVATSKLDEYINAAGEKDSVLFQTGVDLSNDVNDGLGSADTETTGKNKTEEYKNGINSIDVMTTAANKSSEAKSGLQSIAMISSGQKATNQYNMGLSGIGTFDTGKGRANEANSGFTSINMVGSGKGATNQFNSGLSSVSTYGTGKNTAANAKSGMDSVDTSSSGKFFGQGFINGLASMAQSAWNAGWNFVKNAWAGLKAGQKEGSPSKLTYQSGLYFVEGFVNAISDNAKVAVKVAKTMAQESIEALSNELDTEANMPQIKTNMRITRNAVKNSPTAVRFDSGGGQVVNNYNFYQTNNSPKALSRLEIYRQTKNQLNFAKGV